MKTMDRAMDYSPNKTTYHVLILLINTLRRYQRIIYRFIREYILTPFCSPHEMIDTAETSVLSITTLLA